MDSPQSIAALIRRYPRTTQTLGWQRIEPTDIARASVLDLRVMGCDGGGLVADLDRIVSRARGLSQRALCVEDEWLADWCGHSGLTSRRDPPAGRRWCAPRRAGARSRGHTLGQGR